MMSWAREGGRSTAASSPGPTSTPGAVGVRRRSQSMNATATYRFYQNKANVTLVAFNLLNNEHREHPFGQVVQRKMMAFFGYQF